jgi:uncharacterized membrane protein
MSIINDNVVKATFYLLDRLKVKYTDISINDLKLHPTYPDLNSVISILDELGIENMPVRIDISQLNNIPYPALAHVNSRNGEFIVLLKKDERNITYFDTEVGIVVEQLDKFEEKWGGVILLVKSSSSSGEFEYFVNYKKVKLKRFVNYTSIIIFTLFLIWIFLSLAENVKFLFALNLVGLFFSINLLLRQLGFKMNILDSYCSVGNSSCDDVLESNRLKLFGEISLAEVSSVYFSSELIGLSISKFINIEYPSFLLSILSIPLVSLTLYYQFQIIKKHCNACLTISALLISKLIYFILFNFNLIINLSSLIYLVSIGLPLLLLWLNLKDFFVDAAKLESANKRLKKFNRNFELFKLINEKLSKIDLPPVLFSDFRIQDPKKINVTVVSNPTCKACETVHIYLMKLEEKYKDNLNFSFVFLPDLANKKSLSYQMVETVCSLHLASLDVKHAIDDWYKYGKWDFDKWIKDYSNKSQYDSLQVENIIKSHFIWSNAVKIERTPTIVINNKILPYEYNVYDLNFLFSQILK